MRRCLAVFFTSFLPQFVGTRTGGTELLLLGALFNAMGLAWLVTYALVGRADPRFSAAPAPGASSTV